VPVITLSKCVGLIELISKGIGLGFEGNKLVGIVHWVVLLVGILSSLGDASNWSDHGQPSCCLGRWRKVAAFELVDLFVSLLAPIANHHNSDVLLVQLARVGILTV
jgi:hypothetical protein